jgi:quinol monooxygenase YgiN
MVLEIAQFTAQPGKSEALQAALVSAGIPIIRRAEGCHSVTLRRQIEDAQVFILEIEWETLEIHTITFRGGPLYTEYRSAIAGLFVDPIFVRHYEQVGG